VGKQRERQEKKLLGKDQFYCKNSIVGQSRRTHEKPKLAFARQRPGFDSPHLIYIVKNKKLIKSWLIVS